MTKRRHCNGQGTLFKRRTNGSWIAGYYDHDARRREKSTRTTDRKAAERILQKLVADAALRREGVIDPRLEAVSNRSRQSIAVHLVDWKAELESKGNSPKRVTVATRRVQKVVDDCGFTMLADVDAVKVQQFILTLQRHGAAARTINGYIQVLKQFIGWSRRENRLMVDPLMNVGAVKVIEQKRNRRPLSADELARLIDTTETGGRYRRFAATDRAMLYRLATGTGFRASELASLTPGCFDLRSDPPAVTVRAAYSKRRRDDRQPIRADLAAVLKHWLEGRPVSQRVFMTMPEKLARMIRRDMRLAKARWIRDGNIPAERRRRRDDDFLAIVDVGGRVVDFHALRATYITLLVRGGASVKVAQELARHSDPKLTLNVYTKLGIHDLAGALHCLPATGSANTSIGAA